MPAYFRRRSVHGHYAVYETSPEGYFGLVDIVARYDGPAVKWFDPVSGWLLSALPRVGQVVALDPYLKGVPAIERWQPMPAPHPVHDAAAVSSLNPRPKRTIARASTCYAPAMR